MPFLAFHCILLLLYTLTLIYPLVTLTLNPDLITQSKGKYFKSVASDDHITKEGLNKKIHAKDCFIAAARYYKIRQSVEKEDKLVWMGFMAFGK